MIKDAMEKNEKTTPNGAIAADVKKTLRTGLDEVRHDIA